MSLGSGPTMIMTLKVSFEGFAWQQMVALYRSSDQLSQLSLAHKSLTVDAPAWVSKASFVACAALTLTAATRARSIAMTFAIFAGAHSTMDPSCNLSATTISMLLAFRLSFAADGLQSALISTVSSAPHAHRISKALTTFRRSILNRLPCVC